MSMNFPINFFVIYVSVQSKFGVGGGGLENFEIEKRVTTLIFAGELQLSAVGVSKKKTSCATNSRYVICTCVSHGFLDSKANAE